MKKHSKLESARKAAAKKAALKKVLGALPNGSPSKASGATDSIAGFALDKPTAKKDQAFVRTVDVKLREVTQVFEQVLKAEDFSQVIEDYFVSNIRKLCGMEKKVLELQLTQCMLNHTHTQTKHKSFDVCVVVQAPRARASFSMDWVGVGGIHFQQHAVCIANALFSREAAMDTALSN